MREGITNAVCHRDYADSGNVLVKIFDDRLEIWNPGSLPPGLTVDDLRKSHESMPRNKLIARAFFLIKYIEQFGTGTGRMINDCLEAGVPEPDFESRASTFRIIFRLATPPSGRFGRMGLNEQQLRVMQHISKGGQVRLGDLTKVFTLPKRTLQRALQELTKRGLLIKHGTGKSTWYETTK